MRRTTIDLVRLAELLVDRLGSALPQGVVAGTATEEDLEAVRAMHTRMGAHRPLGFPAPPEYGHADGVLCISLPPSPSRRIIALTLEHQRIFTDVELRDAVVEALDDVADEASEASADHHECDAAVEGDRLRIWFGTVPPGTPQIHPPWREVVVELAPIPLDQIAGSALP